MIVQELEHGGLLHDVLAQVIATLRGEMRKEFTAAIEEERCTFASRLAEQAERLRAVPGKLSPAKIWHEGCVTYQGELAAFGGELHQALRDTGQKPGGSDWLLVSRAGRDGLTPTVRGTYDVHETYRLLDIVVSDGAAFIARKGNPGICPGEG